MVRSRRAEQTTVKLLDLQWAHHEEAMRPARRAIDVGSE